MGYTHYWTRIKELRNEAFQKVVQDTCRLIVGLEKGGLSLAGPHGDGKPELGQDFIAFNGVEDCGHTRRELGITWPSDHANGIGEDIEIEGQWFAGALLTKRSCGGDCSHESFVLPRVFRLREWSEPDEHGRYFDCCKTAYKPYDLAVISCLLIAKHHLGDDIMLSSDGTPENWADGVDLVKRVFGYEVVAPGGDEE